jgi:deoxyribodipyrimidine photo-lyase
MFKKHGNRFFNVQGFSDVKPHVKPQFIGGKSQFEKWKTGQTENEQVNYIMDLLNTTGYIDQRMRTHAASFLVNELQVNWLWGAAYFEEKLIDYSPATNYGHWAHIAGVGSSFKHNLKLIS